MNRKKGLNSRRKATGPRMKEKRVRAPNAAETRHIERVVAIGCLLCGAEAEYHHIHTDGFQKLLRDHRYGAPLCASHHRGDYGIHTLQHWGFLDAYDIDLWQWAQEAWRVSQDLERAAA